MFSSRLFLIAHIFLFIFFMESGKAQNLLPAEESVSLNMSGTKSKAPLFSFACIADIQYADKDNAGTRRYREGPDKLKKAINFLNGQKSVEFSISLGDLVDGAKKDEIDKLLSIYGTLDCNLYHVVGNHDRVKYSKKELKGKLNLNNFTFSFQKPGYRFLIIENPIAARFPKGSTDQLKCEEIQKNNSRLRPYDCFLTESIMSWMERQFLQSRENREKVVVCSHVPVNKSGIAAKGFLWNSAEILELLKKYNDVVAMWLSGHRHGGDYFVKDKIHHLTIPAICDAPMDSNAFAVMKAYDDKIIVEGYGTVPYRVLNINKDAILSNVKQTGTIKGKITDDSGKAVTSAVIISNNGRVTKSDSEGNFSIPNLILGGYAIKVLKTGYNEYISANLDITEDTTISLNISLNKAANPKTLIMGVVKDKSSGEEISGIHSIKDASGAIRWFDVNGTPYGGREDIPPKAWHQKNTRFWTSGKFAFLANNGEVKIKAYADGYLPAKLTLNTENSDHTNIGMNMQKLFSPDKMGWYKGDFHAHAVHGQCYYKINVPFAAFILRAEHYRWFYLSGEFNNDGFKVDNQAIAAQENTNKFFLALNEEFPKTAGGHYGNVGIGPPLSKPVYPDYSNLETIKTHIHDKGGVAIPVHPLYSHMRTREFPFDLIGAPELISGFDFYTSWNADSEKTYYMLLNKGYKLCRTATSDAAMDLGRTPGTKGATYLFMGNDALNRVNIINAFKKGRSSIAWYSTFLDFQVDGKHSGEVFPSAGTPLKAKVDFYYKPSVKVSVKVIRNGETFKELSATTDTKGKVNFDFQIKEHEKAWYSAICFLGTKQERCLAATSPIYFGNWETPDAVKAIIAVNVFDMENKQRINAKIDVMEADTLIRSYNYDKAPTKLAARAFQRLRISADGYITQEISILNTPKISEYISNMSAENLQDWNCYDHAAELLRTIKCDIYLKTDSNK